jgi:hypothetical protein
MRPTRGLTPAFTTPGPKRYVYFGRDRVALAIWDDDRPRVPVRWVSHAAWRKDGWHAREDAVSAPETGGPAS